MTDKEQEDFECWARNKGLDLEYRNFPDIGKFYESPRTIWSFEAWQASRDSLVIELPPIPKAQRTDEEATFSAGGCDMRRKCSIAIEAAGLKVQP